MNSDNPQPAAPGWEIPDFPADPHLMDYLLLVAKHKWVVVLLLICCTAAALGLTYIVPYSYRSEVMLLPPDRLSSSGLLSSLNAGGALKIMKEVENPSVDLIQNLLESYALSDRLSQDSSIWHYFSHPGETHHQLVEHIQSCLLTLPGFSKVNVQCNLATGWFSTPREKEVARHLAPYIANLACRTMDTIIGEVLRSDAKQARRFADSDYTDRNRELDSLDRVKAAFEEANGVPALEAQTLATISEIGRLEADEDQAEIHLEVLERDYSPSDPRVEAAQAELESAREARSRYEVASAIGPGFDTLPTISREYAEILRNEATLEPIVTFLREERDQQEIFAERVRSVITIVDTAKVPDARFSPKRGSMVALGFCGGGFFSILYLALAVFLSANRSDIGTDDMAPSRSRGETSSR